MATNFPASIDALTNPNANDDTSIVSHAAQHQNANDAIEALEAKVGANSSAVTTSHDYKLGEVTGSDKAVGKTATQTLTNKTLTTPIINIGSDSTGDLYYRSSGGGLSRLGIGANNSFLTSNGTTPLWATSTLGDATYTSKGTVQGLTDATTSGLVISSGVISVNSGTSANQIVKLNSSAKLPAVDGSLLTNVTPMTMGTTSQPSASTSDLVIAHGLPTTPRLIRISATRATESNGAGSSSGSATSTSNEGSVGRSGHSSSEIVYTSATSIIYILSGSSSSVNVDADVKTLDATNITLRFNTNTNPGFSSPVYILWEAYA